MTRNIFENVSFLNETDSINIVIELADTSIMNEQIILKYVKKDQVPKEFGDIVLEILDAFEKNRDKKIKFDNFGLPSFKSARDKVTKGKLKNYYTFKVTVNEALKGTGKEVNMKNKFLMTFKYIEDYAKSVVVGLGFKKINSGGVGDYDAFYKQGDGCIYVVDTYIVDTDVFVAIRCIEDTEENKRVITGNRIR